MWTVYSFAKNCEKGNEHENINQGEPDNYFVNWMKFLS